MLEKTLPVNSNIPLSDRIKHKEGMVLSFVSEHSLPFSSARNIVELAKDPMAILAKSTVSLKAILHLPEIVKNVLSSTDQNENCEKECRRIKPTLPPAIVDKTL